ncbi:hypothetical protein DFQ26_001150 [Actinomortierella ambigua]|nr:hypothetical protein DFQ26_001150 [Actinomortierella ambigua]
MIRRLSVLATFLLLATLQVCAAFMHPAGLYKLSCRGMSLYAEGDTPGSPVTINDVGRSTLWEITPHGYIIDTGSGLFLDYEKKDMNAALVVTSERVEWKIERLERGYEIRVQGTELVIGVLHHDPLLPTVALTRQDKEGSQTWDLVPLHLDPTPFVPDGDFMLKLRKLYLGVFGKGPSELVFLLDRPSKYTVWTVVSDGPSGSVSIQNRETKLYLSYDPGEPDKMLRTTFQKSFFCLRTIKGNVVHIIAELIDKSFRAVAKSPIGIGGQPPLVNLAQIGMDREQIWKLEPVQDLDNSPRQYPLPFRRLRSW